jgi:hypothetical protein
MVWLARLLLIPIGFLIGRVMLNVYYAFCVFFSITLLGIENETFHSVEYWACLIAGFVTSFLLMRRAWPRQSESGAGRVSVAAAPAASPAR